jgi:para-aminobenzoate synthetase/4-amino-4-deoxychorismate lyase
VIESQVVRLRFDFADATGRPAPVIYERPIREIVAGRIDEVPAALRDVDRAVAEGRHAAGFVAYEAASAFDAALPTRAARGPLVWFGVFDAATAAGPLSRPAPAFDAPGEATTWTPDDTPGRHRRAVDAVREAIAAGDVYQANYTFRLRGDVDAARLEARYLRLAAAHHPPFAAYLDFGSHRVLSLSPELFFRIRGRRIETRPMKGTARRGRWAGEDAAMRTALAASEKDRAENVMIVDMARNDLGRVADVGSVRVQSLFDVERYPTVFQMASTVEAMLGPGVTLAGVFGALFPAASITGAPKTSSMRLLSALESSPRGVYCGVIGYATPGGEAVFNVAIRTMTVDARSGRAEFGTGGGITWDSAAAGEYAEAIAKTACLVEPPAFALIETMRLDAGSYVRIDRHLARLLESAWYFDFEVEQTAIEAALDAHARAHPDGVRRARLGVSRDGRADVESRPLEAAPPGPPPVAVARSPVDRSDVFLHHKTSHRQVYEAHTDAHPGVFDVLLWNREGEVTEFTRGNVVLELDGIRVTPPRTCGLLGGVLRQELVDGGRVDQRVLTLADLTRATRVWFINCLRGWIEVQRPRFRSGE